MVYQKNILDLYKYYYTLFKFKMVTRNEIIAQVAVNKQLKDYCSMLCKGRDIKEDMWQELLLVMCEKADDVLVKMHSEGYLFKWCGSVLKNMNRDRIDINKSKKTKRQALKEISYSHVELSGREIVCQEDENNDEALKGVIKHLRKIGANPNLIVLPIKELCVTTGRTEGSVKWERSNIIKSVRESIKRECIPAK